MNKRQVFKQVAIHLLSQNKKSESFDDQNRCLYRSGYLSCAVGCLISDDYYRETLEDQCADSIQVKEAIANSLKTTINAKDVSILRLLQRIHDDEEIEDWDKCLETLSKDLFNKNLDELGVTA